MNLMSLHVCARSGDPVSSVVTYIYHAAPGELSEDTSKALLNKAYELGVRLFNTSDL
jgi:aryl-alcohol dehydrogenase-like predicted oxidoreductase